LVDEGDVFVTDSVNAKVYHFNLDGDLLSTFGEGILVVPLYLAKSPTDGNLYIVDRRTRKVQIFTTEGEYIEEFDPDLPDDELADFETGNVQWAPVAVTFAPDGSMFVTEILNGHRVLKFAPDGTFEKSAGDAAFVTVADTAQGFFQFPNSVKVRGEELWIADSNNRRIQVYDLDLEPVRLVPTEGLPRGMDWLAPSDPDTDTPDKLVVVDTLAHDGTVWEASGERLISFGENGVLDGQFAYPNDISVSARQLLFITDTANGRIQVWGWPSELAPPFIPTTAQQWGWCLSPLLLLPLLLLTRKRKFFATLDFVEGMLLAELVYTMPARRRRWGVSPEDYELLKDRVQEDIRLVDLLHAEEHSESDVKALMERLELDHPTAVTLAIAQRSYVFCTEDENLRRLAKVLELDVVNREEYLERFATGEKPAETPRGA
jgi:sugar lactone lactonase YvrE/predicted nucleic acid-binding protein